MDYFSDEKKKVFNLVDYFTGKINKNENINLVLENGNYATEEEKDKRKNYMLKQFNNSNLWQIVLSIDHELIDNSINWKDLEKKLAKEILPKLFKKMGFINPKNMCYQFSLHGNTEHTHFHIAFMEKKPNTRSHDNRLMYMRTGKISMEAINYLKSEVLLTIEREKYFTPLSTNINKDIEEIKKYFKAGTKNYILYNKDNIFIEDKILSLGKMLEEKNKYTQNKIKFNSIKEKEIIKLTKEIKKDIFESSKVLTLDQKELKKSLDDMNQYLNDLLIRNNVSKKELVHSYIKNKNEYLDNYILNAIVNYSKNHYKNQKKKIIITSDDIIQAIICNVYNKNNKITKKQLVINHFSNNYKNKLRNEIYNSIKKINYEMENAKKEFEKIFIDKLNTKSTQYDV